MTDRQLKGVFQKLIMSQQSSRRFSRIFVAIGGVVGILTICGLIVAVAELWQSVNAQSEDDKAQATEVAYDQAHLDALIKIVTLQAQLVNQVPESTAIAIAEQIADLQATIETSSSAPTPHSVSSVLPAPSLTPIQLPEIQPTSTIRPNPSPAVVPTSEVPSSASSISNLPYLVVVVGCTNTTAFSCSDAQNYNHNNGTYFEVSTALEAENLLLQRYQEYDAVYAVHVPNLRVTLNDPGACWLHVNQVDLLESYPRGWVVGENVKLADQIAELEPCFPSTSATKQVSESSLIVFGYMANDLAVQQAMANCTSCLVIYLSSLNDIADDWKHYTHNVATASANLSDGCRTKQELVRLSITFMIANNYTPCP